MNFIRKITDSDLLAGIVSIPENMRHKKVELIILPYDEGKEKIREGIKKNVRGLLRKYVNIDYLPLEETAWAEAVRESNENS